MREALSPSAVPGKPLMRRLINSTASDPRWFRTWRRPDVGQVS